jgi:hypothetical protein
MGSRLEKVNHAGHEIAIDILLNLRDVVSLQEHLEDIPRITGQLQKMYPSADKPVELINTEMSFVRLKRVIANLKRDQAITKPLLEQVRNEIIKINTNVAALKDLSEQEIKKLQTRAERMISVLFILLVTYIGGGGVLLNKMVIMPVLALTRQIEQIKDGHLENLTLSPRKDEIGQLAREFNLLIAKRREAEEELKQEIVEHKKALDKVKLLSGFLPICASCKKIRDDRGYWKQIETYIRDNSEVEFSHGICPECVDKLYPNFLKKTTNDQAVKKKKSGDS